MADLSQQHAHTRISPLYRAALLAALALVVLGSASGARALSAHAARVVSIKDEAHLRFTGETNSGEYLEEGNGTGTLPGRVRVRLNVGSTVTAGFTIYLHGGTISGHGSAKLHGSNGEYASFGGTLAVSHGSGSYSHANGSGQLYGALNRYNRNVIVQVIGQLHT